MRARCNGRFCFAAQAYGRKMAVISSKRYRRKFAQQLFPKWALGSQFVRLSVRIYLPRAAYGTKRKIHRMMGPNSCAKVNIFQLRNVRVGEKHLWLLLVKKRVNVWLMKKLNSQKLNSSKHRLLLKRGATKSLCFNKRSGEKGERRESLWFYYSSHLLPNSNEWAGAR